MSYLTPVLLHVWLFVSLSSLSRAAPLPSNTSNSALSDPNYGPVPDESSLYSTYTGISPPFPANITGAILNTTYSDSPPSDDLLFQNLLSAEWIIFSFYQAGVEAFNISSFSDAGFPNTTYLRIQQIRDNEAGHLRIFQDSITSASIKPGPCRYIFPFTDPSSFLALQTIIEVSSMAFLTGLELEVHKDTSKAALVAIAATESRHNTWSLIDNWNASPFAGPTDTVFPYAKQILAFTNEWVIPGSCPLENPPFPDPDQNLPALAPAESTTTLAPGSTITFRFPVLENQPDFSSKKQYYAVFFHGVSNISMPFDTTNNQTTIPPQFEALGVFIAVIADKEGAPTKESVVAGPSILLESPVAVGLSLY